MPSSQVNGTLEPNQISSQVKCLMTVQDVMSSQFKCLMIVQDVISSQVKCLLIVQDHNFQSNRNHKKFIHLAFDDTMTCKQFKDFSSILPSYGCLYTTVKFV